ncbi:hypothetical protein AMTRI_Chr04g187930 [Amborella trichopoda]
MEQKSHPQASRVELPPVPDRPHQVPTGSPGPWLTGLFACFEDPANSCGKSCALYGLLLLLFGQASCYSCSHCSKLRSQYNLEGSPCGDFLVHWCCEPCALCQEYRDLKSCGFDMKIGWHGNVEKKTRGATPFHHPLEGA